MLTPDTEPFKLKNIYTRELLAGYADLLKITWPPFPVDDFLAQIFDEHWEGLELKERMRHISTGLRNQLPEDYREAVEILSATVRTLIAEQGEKMVFEYGFLPDFVQRYGLDDPDRSIPALAHLTRWTSAEFAVRPYLKDYPDRMYTQMREWSDHPSPYVRRLASEGFRPRLPWGMGIPVLKKDPAPILPVLENLKNDPAETVRRSVANNLNDISKDHPALVLGIAGRWLGDHPDTDWIVRHACRGLLRKGHPEALQLFGFDPDLDTIAVVDLVCSPEVQIGERLHFSFTLKNEGRQPARIRLEYAIDYLTSTGKISRKVFKIKAFELQPSQEEAFAKNQRFQDFTTRKHYAGAHRIGVLVNGREVGARGFLVG